MKVVLIVIATLFAATGLLLIAGLGLPGTLLRKVKKRTKGKWESHPCELPKNLDLPLEGRVWQCHCGRRWKYLRTTSHDYPHSPVKVWEERTPEMDMKDEMEKLEKLTRKAKESGL